MASTSTTSTTKSAPAPRDTDNAVPARKSNPAASGADSFRFRDFASI